MRLPNKFLLQLLITVAVLTACENSDPVKPVVVPDTYAFERNGSTTVVYSGQTDRLNQVAEMKAYFQKGDQGNGLSATALNDMFSNAGGNGGGNFTFSSDGKQLRDKTFAPDVAYFEDLFARAEEASEIGGDASEGKAGYLLRSNGNQILVDAHGLEFTQAFEKGIMGSVFINQMFNVYLTDERIGNDVENTTLDGSNNYTKMEHHWDEAFGYFGAPIDFPTNTVARFWGNYSNQRDELLGTNEILMNAFKAGRAAIVAKRYDIKNQQRDILYQHFELLAAATAIHYLNEAKTLLAQGQSKYGDAFHVLTEARGFVSALRLSPIKRISTENITLILDDHIGQNLWALAETDLEGLTTAVSTLVAAYPELGSIKDQL